MKRVLIIGASGFVGSNLARYLRKHYRVFGTFGHHPIRIDGVTPVYLPIAPSSPLQETIKLIRPDAIVYCAARINEQHCLEDPRGTTFINAEAPLLLARAGEANGVRFIYFSTSKVFDGTKGDYAETDTLNPQGPYGRSKRIGEENLRAFDNSIIFRLGTVYGFGSIHQESAILNRILKQLTNNTDVKFINDEIRSFVWAEEVAHAVGIAIDTSFEHVGTYHLGGPTKDTYFQFVTQLARIFGLHNVNLHPISGKEFAGKEAIAGGSRGSDLSLSAQSFSETFHTKFSPPDKALEKIRRQLHLGVQ